MANESSEIPRAQTHLKDLTLAGAKGYEDEIKVILKALKLDFNRVRTVLDLYAGNGAFTLGAVRAFPNAQIHAVDYHNALAPDAKSHPHVTFHQGMIPDVLRKPDIPRADIVIMSSSTILHGLNQENISVLASRVGRFLITVGDTFVEEQGFFKRTFGLTAYETAYDSVVWKVK